MTRIRKFLSKAAMAAIAMSLLTVVQPAMAQEQDGTARGREHGHMAELNLTADQQAKLKQMHEQNRAQMMTLRQDQSLSQQDREQKMQALRQSQKTQMNSILTPDQQQKLDSLRASRNGARGERGERGKGRGEKGEGRGADRMAEKLNLSAEQKTKMQSIFQSNHQQMSAIRDNQSLSQQDKQAKMQQLHQSMKSQIDGVLTAEQQQKFAQMRERKGGRGHGRKGFGASGQDKPETPQNPGE